ncbi:MAG: DUF7738 domain-containing protein [Aequorivita sp.]
MGIFDFRDPSKRKTKQKSIRIQCDPKEVRINETTINFPTSYATLKKVFGEASRIEPFKQTGIKVYLWDDLGIYCSAPDPDNILMLMLILDNGYDLGHQPKSNFTNDLVVDGVAVVDDLPNVKPDRTNIVRALYKENKLVAVAIGWNSKA